MLMSTKIKDLSSVDSLSGSDSLVQYSNQNSDTRKFTLTTLLAWLQANLTFTAQSFVDYVTQYAAPSATGFNVTITDGADDDGNVHLILTPTAGYAAGTITLPAVASCIDKQRVLVNCTQQVTALTVDGNGATAVTGEPTSLAADDFFELKFDFATLTWYRVG
jgi:hypothetical protein